MLYLFEEVGCRKVGCGQFLKSTLVDEMLDEGSQLKEKIAQKAAITLKS
jgi:hypothetical protein